MAIHGTGFSSLGGFAQLTFGSVVISILEIVSDSLLRCRSPPHHAGIVSVRLSRCAQLPHHELELDTASFEFVRLEAAYDTIFATTNSYCPIRSANHDGEEAASQDSRAPR